MNLLEADYGIGPLVDIEDVINAGIEKLSERNKQKPWFDGYWMNDYGEVLFGTLLVTTQAYCAGCVSDINSIREDFGLSPLKKFEAYHDYHLSLNGFSAIELINQGANCFKHRDEWGDFWPDNFTTRTLSAFSITKELLYPINSIVDILEVDFGHKKLSELVSDWREELIMKSKINS
jgi:hypothetical protein